MTRLAVISDVHGNLPALEAVRKAVHAARPDLVAVTGDHVFNGPDPAGVVDLLRDDGDRRGDGRRRQHGRRRR